VPGVSGFAEAAYYSIITLEVALAMALYLEWRGRQVRLPFVIVLCFFVGMHILMTPVATSEPFAAFASWFATIWVPGRSYRTMCRNPPGLPANP
jgi:hypothetical protein